MSATTSNKNSFICAIAATILLIASVCVFIGFIGNDTVSPVRKPQTISINNTTSETLKDVKIVVNSNYEMSIKEIRPFSAASVDTESENWAESVIYSIRVSGNHENGELFKSHFYEENPEETVFTAIQDSDKGFYISAK